MGWLWENVLKPVLKGVSKILETVVAWSFKNPLPALAIGLGLAVVSPWLEDVPWIQSVVQWTSGIMISSAISGAIWGGVKEGAEWGWDYILRPVLGIKKRTDLSGLVIR